MWLKVTKESQKQQADRLWTCSLWFYGGIAALLIVLGIWRVGEAVWDTGSMLGRTALAVAVGLAAALAARDLRRRQMGIFTGLVLAVWFVLTLLVILFGDFYFLVADP